MKLFLVLIEHKTKKESWEKKLDHLNSTIETFVQKRKKKQSFAVYDEQKPLC